MMMMMPVQVSSVTGHHQRSVRLTSVRVAKQQNNKTAHNTNTRYFYEGRASVRKDTDTGYALDAIIKGTTEKMVPNSTH